MGPRALKLPVPLPRLLGPGEIIAGAGALSALRALPAARVAVIASARAAVNPQVNQWLQGNSNYVIQHVLPSWRGEPSLADLDATTAELRAFRPDWIVAIGAVACWTAQNCAGLSTNILTSLSSDSSGHLRYPRCVI